LNNRTTPYSRFDTQQLILRDELALDRTILANERTLLAYLRTVLALLLAGVTFLHFAQALWFTIVGVVCLVIGLAVLPLAVWRYRRMQTLLVPLRLRMSDAASANAVHVAEQSAARANQKSLDDNLV
jgi:putative membrane protein